LLRELTKNKQLTKDLETAKFL